MVLLKNENRLLPLDAGRCKTIAVIGENATRLARSEKELKGFRKVFLRPGEKQTVSVPLSKTAFSCCDDGIKSWVAENDSFEGLIGSLSRDIRLRDNFDPAAK